MEQIKEYTFLPIASCLEIKSTAFAYKVSSCGPKCVQIQNFIQEGYEYVHDDRIDVNYYNVVINIQQLPVLQYLCVSPVVMILPSHTDVQYIYSTNEMHQLTSGYCVYSCAFGFP